MPEVTDLHPVKKIALSLFRSSEFAYARYSVTLPVGWTLDEILDPEAWAQVAHVLDRVPVTGEPPRVGTIIEVRTEDHAFYAELYVRAVRKMALDVQVISGPVTLGVEKKDPQKFDVRWNVGKRAFDIVRKSDRVIVADGLPKKEDAYAWIEKTAA